MFALRQCLEDQAGAVRYADHSPGPRQVFGVADGDMRVRRAEHEYHPLQVLLSSLRRGEGGCRAGVPDGPRVEVRDIRGPDGVPPGRGSCRLLGALMVCSRTASGQGSAVT